MLSLLTSIQLKGEILKLAHYKKIRIKYPEKRYPCLRINSFDIPILTSKTMTSKEMFIVDKRIGTGYYLIEEK